MDKVPDSSRLFVNIHNDILSESGSEFIDRVVKDFLKYRIDAIPRVRYVS